MVDNDFTNYRGNSMRFKLVLVAALSAIILSACDRNDNDSSNAQLNISSDTDKLSYTIGVDLGTNFRDQQIDINPELLKQGMADVLSGRDLRLSQDEMDETLSAFQEEIISKRAAQLAQLSEENRQAGQAFMQQVCAQDGVNKLPSGICYKVLEQGSGKTPSENDTVVVDYEGSLINGTVIDSSQGEPVTLIVNQLIPGWQETLTNMKEGDKWEVYVPAELAYGAQGAGIIGPNETLQFQIHLISVNPANGNGTNNQNGTNNTNN
jgi:FKBP-type peptidyl-prolyl cis-trans isomerase FklB